MIPGLPYYLPAFPHLPFFVPVSPRVKSIEYHPCGRVKRVEYFDDQPKEKTCREN